MDSIIERITKNAASIKPEEIDDIVKGVVVALDKRIRYLAWDVYANDAVGLPAFRQRASETIKSGLESFLFKKEHWRTGRSIEPYLLACLSKLAYSLKNDDIKKVSVPICPGCKSLNIFQVAHNEGKMLRCTSCTSESERLGAEEKKLTSKEAYELRIRTAFSVHSKSGWRCPGCAKFIPKSLIGNKVKVSCPYDSCDWFGVSSELEPMAHPTGHVAEKNRMVSLVNETRPEFSDSKTSLIDRLDSKTVNADLLIEHDEKYQKDLKVIKSVIQMQKTKAEIGEGHKNLKKQFMYQAFEDLLEKDPDGMIGYLMYGKTVTERPIQSMIFQKYISIIQNNLPITVMGETGPTEVYSLLDPGLELFIGMSTFESFVRDSGLVSNNTHEVFAGPRCNGPCFIGWLCGVEDAETGKSLLSEVDYYTFCNLRMKASVPPNTLIRVTHLRIPPHYEMYSLVLLQRTRKRIVDSIYKRVNGGAIRPADATPGVL